MSIPLWESGKPPFLTLLDTITLIRGLVRLLIIAIRVHMFTTYFHFMHQILKIFVFHERKHESRFRNILYFYYFNYNSEIYNGIDYYYE